MEGKTDLNTDKSWTDYKMERKQVKYLYCTLC